MLLKLDGFLRPYRGSGDDWEQFWSKFSVLAEVSGWDTEAKMMARFPLFIEGPPFLVFSKDGGRRQEVERQGAGADAHVVQFVEGIRLPCVSATGVECRRDA